MNPIEKDEPASTATSAIDPKAASAGETRIVAGVFVPDTPLIARAIEYAHGHSEPYLFNHVMRSWLFAVSLAQLNQSAHDGEVLAVATLSSMTSGWRKRLTGRCDLKWRGRMPHGSSREARG
jgi:hypothetical protein